MKLLIWVCVAQTIWPNAFGIYHMLSMEVFRPLKHLQNDSFFGYSITYDREHKRLISSAPRENYIGVVYQCDLEHKNCSPIKVDIPRDSPEYKHDYWFGATVKAGPKFVVMCAPRSISLFTKFNKFGERGKCYKYAGGVVNKLREISENEIIQDTPGPFEMKMDSFGWSIDVAPDDSIIVGGPGMFTGRVMVYSPGRATPEFINRRNVLSELNFGYSVSSGTFINGRLSYAVGSTYGKYGYGQVQFFKEVERQTSLKKMVDYDIVGTMFGGVLCAAMLTGRRTDLLVGAPTYASKSTYNLGAVYIYLAKKEGRSPEYKRKIQGQKDGAMFGSAIVSLGDMNGDKKDEVAISAPFENNGRGVVYLYSGADLISDKTEQTLKPLQRIDPEPTLNIGTSFGLSLTPLVDYDENGCNELAIGSPYSDAVALLHCMATITVKTYTNFTSLQNRTNTGQTDFVFQICLSVEYPSKPETIMADISTTVLITHPQAFLSKAADHRNYTFTTAIRDKKPEYCSDIDLVLPLDGIYDLEITFNISSVLLDNPLYHKEFNSHRVLLSDRSVLKIQESLWAAECSGHKECIPNLELGIASSFKDGYIIGSSDKENITLSLTNTGEVTYDACLYITGQHVFQVPSLLCEFTLRREWMLCKLKPLRTNQTWISGPIDLKMSNLTSQDRNITFDVLLYNHCKDNQTRTFSHVITLKSDPSGIDVKGFTSPGEPVNMTKTDIEDGKRIEHVYKIKNQGLTIWKNVRAYVTLQKKQYIQYNDKTVLLHIGKSLIVCQLVKNSTETMEFSCKIHTLAVKGQDETRIMILIDIVPGSLDGVLDKDHTVIIQSNMLLVLSDIDNIQKKYSILSTLVLTEAYVPWWVWLVAALFGLIILIIIAIILYQCGFMRRKNKEELEKLKRSVKRQTIRRSMMQTQAPPDDRRNILDKMEEENEDVREGGSDTKNK